MDFFNPGKKKPLNIFSLKKWHKKTGKKLKKILKQRKNLKWNSRSIIRYFQNSKFLLILTFKKFDLIMVKKYWTFINISLHVLFYGETARARSGAMLQLVGNRGALFVLHNLGTATYPTQQRNDHWCYLMPIKYFKT